MIKLTQGQIMTMHTALVGATGGSDGVRDYGMLESALCAPFQTFGGQDVYPTILQKAARLGHSVVADHPFVDGNKRIGVHSMLVFLALNGVDINCSQQSLIETGLSLASGSMSYEQLLAWLENNY